MLEWLQDLMTRLKALAVDHGLRPATSRRIYQGPAIYLDGSATKWKMDVGIVACHEQGKGDDNEANGKSDTTNPNWDQILVIGELRNRGRAGSCLARPGHPTLERYSARKTGGSYLALPFVDR